jgi:hypothetical protein
MVRRGAEAPRFPGRSLFGVDLSPEALVFELLLGRLFRPFVGEGQGAALGLLQAFDFELHISPVVRHDLEAGIAQPLLNALCKVLWVIGEQFLEQVNEDLARGWFLWGISLSLVFGLLGPTAADRLRQPGARKPAPVEQAATLLGLAAIGHNDAPRPRAGSTRPMSFRPREHCGASAQRWRASYWF